MQWAMAGRLDEDVLLDACLHDKRYDRGFNAVRGHWLWPMMQAVDAVDRFRPAILDAIDNLAEDDALQLCELAFHYAETGDDEFRSRLYQIVRDKPFADTRYLGEKEIIRLDGGEAFLLAIGLRGRQLENRDWDWDDSVLMDEAIERLGETQVSELIEATADEAAKRFRDCWRQQQSQAEQEDASRSTSRDRIRQMSARDILSAIESTVDSRAMVRVWGVRASEDDLETVLQYLLSSRDPAIIAKCLMVFWMRAFPRIVPELIDLCHHQDDHVRRRAFAALENNTHPLVRQLAEDQLQRGVPGGLALRLFIKNYQPGDEQRILELAEIPDEDDQRHDLLTDAVNICKENDQADCSQLGLVAYALQPCGMCRGSAAELLHQRKVAPAWLTEECRFDSEEDTRKLVTEP